MRKYIKNSTGFALHISPEEREETRKRPGCPKDGETHPRRPPGDPGRGNSIGEASH